ncbi:hypothetical protein [Mesorhizobium sp. 1M-11]|uniref:glycoside hydrolase family 19 protein n=1 Tax=Mesorhizobium sp. 1M-11 TaxID=1529006 RepID=UPI0006C74948|nr:hypothetical protein [Mesorhizobium sp. 1M-11]
MDRSRFYATLRLRTSGVFGTALSQSQVDGLEVVLDAGQNTGLPLRHIAYALATAYHETGGKMRPVNEGLSYSSATRIREVWPKRFSSIAAAIPYVRNPQGLANRVYAGRMGNGDEASGDGWRYRGRALPQLTGRENYEKASKLVGVDLVSDPDAANDTDISAHILIEGMRAGMFTGKKLADFVSGDCTDYVGARAIINPDVKANGQKIAGYAKAFETALRDAGYISQAPTPAIPAEKQSKTPPPVPTVSPPTTARPEPQAMPVITRSLWAELANIFFLLIHRGA